MLIETVLTQWRNSSTKHTLILMEKWAFNASKSRLWNCFDASGCLVTEMSLSGVCVCVCVWASSMLSIIPVSICCWICHSPPHYCWQLCFPLPKLNICVMPHALLRNLITPERKFLRNDAYKNNNNKQQNSHPLGLLELVVNVLVIPTPAPERMCKQPVFPH